MTKRAKLAKPFLKTTKPAKKQVVKKKAKPVK